MASIALDFDGVLCHCTSFLDISYNWGQLTPDDYVRLAEITDSPVTGAIEALREYLADDRVQVMIFSCRNSQPGGVEAMRRWLIRYGVPVEQIQFPTEKPQATVFVDDRSYPYQSTIRFPAVDEILEFKPWWRGEMMQRKIDLEESALPPMLDAI